MAKASIVFAALALLLLGASLRFNGGTLFYVSCAAAIIGAVLGAMSRGQVGTAGMLLNFIALSIAGFGIAFFTPGPVVTRAQTVETPHAK